MTLRKKWKLKEATKTCTRCGKTYPRTQEYFYAKKHNSNMNAVEYYTACITCSNERSKKWKDKNKEQRRLADIAYKETEEGFFKEMYSGITRSKAGNQFKSYEEFFGCWEEQQKKYGLNCPYFPWIQMTRIKGKKRATPTNISKDRILSSMPYGPKNIMFISWKANNMKGDVTPYLASRYLDFVNENEYSRKVTEFELETMDHKFGHRFTTDFDFIADMVEHNRQSLELQSEFIDKFLKMIKTEPNQLPEDPEDTSHDN